MNEQDKPKSPAKSFIFVAFADVGSVLLNVQYENVTPLQILALADYLMTVGKSKLLLEMQAREEEMANQKLAIPENKIITAHR
jgi:hypothetical protein